jgi:hypothetical protein
MSRDRAQNMYSVHYGKLVSFFIVVIFPGGGKRGVVETGYQMVFNMKILAK